MQRVKREKIIRDKKYTFDVLKAVCSKCGEAVNIPGLMDKNARDIDIQYRQKEGIIGVDDIKSLMELYNIGKAPLSLALGFGEITITRYLAGQIPSKEYSDIIRTALENPDYMEKRLCENYDKLGDTAFKKAINSIKELKPISSLSQNMILAISYIFKKVEEVTPLALQKLLYYIQGIYMVLFDKEFFEEDCQAWVHGPVYKDVYEVFKSFKYNPIEDPRFSMIQNRFDELSEDGKKVIDLIIESFGMYSAKTLEQITHKEFPWKDAREDYLPDEPSSMPISKSVIKNYFTDVAKNYKIDSVDGIKQYIDYMLHN